MLLNFMDWYLLLFALSILLIFKLIILFKTNFIRGLLSSTACISLVYKGRESNVVADQLAKQGLSRRDEFVAWL